MSTQADANSSDTRDMRQSREARPTGEERPTGEARPTGGVRQTAAARQSGDSPNSVAAPAARGSSPAGFQTPFCGELRSKKFFMLDAIASQESDYLDPSGHCWCFHTQRVVGPDRGIVKPDRCVPGRSCYRSALADEA
jgi:hypothetical protein